ncbi:hypothetical protein HPB51_011134 [Rhipicephalus microplus]|uniref:Uncharacterized protein n=1 Tax=Rhipicephalus microplus TaxID=6941 RepID=A0A9J6E1N1_RHIMP|nr:hypothetical protein HPB51_011134 [Rhipicephalus microplus]
MHSASAACRVVLLERVNRLCRAGRTGWARIAETESGSLFPPHISGRKPGVGHRDLRKGTRLPFEITLPRAARRKFAIPRTMHFEDSKKRVEGGGNLQGSSIGPSSSISAPDATGADDRRFVRVAKQFEQLQTVVAFVAVTGTLWPIVATARDTGQAFLASETPQGPLSIRQRRLESESHHIA